MIKGQQWFLTILALAFLGAGFFFISVNFFTPVSYQLFNLVVTDSPMGVPLIIGSVFVAAAVFFKMWEQVITANHQQKRVLQKQQKAEVTAESSLAEVDALKAKIDTLEIALEQSLKNQQIESSPLKSSDV